MEAFSIDAFVRAWFGLLQQNDNKAAGMVRLSVGAHGASRRHSQRTGDLVIERGGAEQSNTSIRIGKGAILKVFRKLEMGIHPEIEIGRFLTADAGFSATPATLGWFELEGVEGISPAIVSVLQAFVPNEGDGWSWVLERLRIGNDHALAQAREWLGRLGERTAEMHRALAQDTKDPAFRPEPVRPRDREAWADTARSSARRALDALARATHQLDSRTSELAVALVNQRDALLERLTEITMDTSIFSRIRHHGDYHLGQVLVAVTMR